MCSEMTFQTGLSFKFLLADLTLMYCCFILLPNFLSQVNSFIVYCQMIMPSEALSALFTLVCLLSGVYLLMFTQMVMADEGFPTLNALVALVVVVNPQVKPVGAAMAETLPTDATEMGLLPAVDPHVLP